MDEKRQLMVVRWTGRVCVAVAIGFAAFAFWKLRDVTTVPAAANVPAAEFAPATHIASDVWEVFAPAPGGGGATEGSPDAKPHRFRLAGIFGVIGENTNEVRKAILDDLETKEQTIVGEGGQLSGWTVQEVGADHAVLVRGGEREVLTMGFMGSVPEPVQAATDDYGLPPEPKETVLEETPYGKKVGDTRWVLSKKAMQDYYQQLLDNPERIAALYMSLKPVYNGKDIEGYHLNQEGERDFFKAMGLAEGDVVRKVNAMNMSSQARAEYFIGEFVKDRLGAVVLDIERNGKPEKLIYLMR